MRTLLAQSATADLNSSGGASRLSGRPAIRFASDQMTAAVMTINSVRPKPKFNFVFLRRWKAMVGTSRIATTARRSQLGPGVRRSGRDK